MQLYEKYRPKDLDTFIGQPKIKRQLQAIMGRSEFDQDAFWIQGSSGTGKTSLAHIIASQLVETDQAITRFLSQESAYVESEVAEMK